MQRTMKYVEQFSYKSYNIMKSLIILVKLHKFKLVDTIYYMKKIYRLKLVKSGAIYENDSTLTSVRVACTKGKEWNDMRVGELHEVNRP